MTDISVDNTLSMTQGMSIEISVDANVEEGRGEFARVSEEQGKNAGKIKLGNNYVDHIMGFVSEYPDVGKIEKATSKDLETAVAVKYTQLQSLPNRIFFITEENVQHTISIITIPVHDHSSIYQGGPAYGAYAFDKVVEEPEEG